jgi:penicillin-binding protein 2
MQTPVGPLEPPREPPPQTPQLALRVAVLGGVAVLLFAVLFFRLWVLQVLDVQAFQAQATENRERTVEVPAPRGMILDRKGRPLVRNRPGDRITFDMSANAELARACGRRPFTVIDSRPDETITRRRGRAMAKAIDALPTKKAQKRRARRIAEQRQQPTVRVWAGCAARSDVLQRLARLTKTPIGDFEDAIHFGLIRSPIEPVTLLTDAPRELVFFLKEHGRAFQGVRIQHGSVRYYPAQQTAAHLFGELTQISAAQLDNKDEYPGAKAGDVVGVGGVEGQYDRFLRGRDGELRLRVNAAGNPEGQVFVSQPTEPGANVRLTIDLDLQKAAEDALKEAVARSQVPGDQRLSADGGAIVALDVKTGAILALASFPSFNPNLLQGKTAEKERLRLGDKKGIGRIAPLFNRAVSGLYPPGSTFKPVTAIAAAQSHLVSPGDMLQCKGSLVVDGQRYNNFEPYVNTALDMRTALAQSCDTYFYQLGKRLYDATPRDGSREPQAEWGRNLGFGKLTKIDISGESAGVLPDIAYKRETYPGDLINNRWTSGDAVLSSIGQGDVQVTPLQIASLYAAIANGGTLVRPHLGEVVERPDGTTLRDLRKDFKPRGVVKIDPLLLSSIRAGLLSATHDDIGTADAVYRSFDPPVAGKTGTAQKAGKRDFAWFAGYAPADNPEIAVVALVEQGGFGGDIAAPAAGMVFAKWFGVNPPPWPVPVDTSNRTLPDANSPTWVLGPNGELVFTDDPASVQFNGTTP